jgi:hypothetical protein
MQARGTCDAKVLLYGTETFATLRTMLAAEVQECLPQRQYETLMKHIDDAEYFMKFEYKKHVMAVHTAMPALTPSPRSHVEVDIGCFVDVVSYVQALHALQQSATGADASSSYADVHAKCATHCIHYALGVPFVQLTQVTTGAAAAGAVVTASVPAASATPKAKGGPAAAKALPKKWTLKWNDGSGVGGGAGGGGGGGAGRGGGVSPDAEPGPVYVTMPSGSSNVDASFSGGGGSGGSAASPVVVRASDVAMSCHECNIMARLYDLVAEVSDGWHIEAKAEKLRQRSMQYMGHLLRCSVQQAAITRLTDSVTRDPRHIHLCVDYKVRCAHFACHMMRMGHG